MKHCLLLIVVSLIPCLAWADQLSRQEAEVLFEQHVLIPCVKELSQKAGRPEPQIPPLTIWKSIRKANPLESERDIVDIIVESPKETLPALFQYLNGFCISRIK